MRSRNGTHRAVPCAICRLIVLKSFLRWGFITHLANPKIAVMYRSFLPQFISPAHGSMLVQSLALGSVQIRIGLPVNALIAVMAGSISAFLSSRPL